MAALAGARQRLDLRSGEPRLEWFGLQVGGESGGFPDPTTQRGRSPFGNRPAAAAQGNQSAKCQTGDDA